MISGKTAEEIRVERNVERSMDGEIVYTPNALRQNVKADPVYIFSVYPEEIRVDKGSLGEIRIPAADPAKGYSRPYTVPGIVSTSYYDAQTNSMKTDDVLGHYIAQDIVHPFIGTDWSINNNLDERGVFWTRNKVPTERELSAARSKLEVNFRGLLEVATRLETTGQLEAITPMMRLAATYFKEDRAWNRMYKKLEPCYACGGDVRAGVIIHSCGAVQPGMWPAAVRAGLKTKAQALEAGIDLEAPQATGKPAKGKDAKPTEKDDPK